MSKPKLLPCPFCGATGDQVEVAAYEAGVRCLGCGAWMPQRVSSEPGESHGAVEGWNRRAYDRP